MHSRRDRWRDRWRVRTRVALMGGFVSVTLGCPSLSVQDLPEAGPLTVPASPDAFLRCVEGATFSRRGDQAYACGVLRVVRECDEWTYMRGRPCRWVYVPEDHEQNLDLVLRHHLWRDVGCELSQGRATPDEELAPWSTSRDDVYTGKRYLSDGPKVERYVVQGCGQQLRYECRAGSLSCARAVEAERWAQALASARELVSCPQVELVKPTAAYASEGFRMVYLRGCASITPVVCAHEEEPTKRPACQLASPRHEDIERARQEAQARYAELARCALDNLAPQLTAQPLVYEYQGGWTQRWEGRGCRGEALVRCSASDWRSVAKCSVQGQSLHRDAALDPAARAAALPGERCAWSDLGPFESQGLAHQFSVQGKCEDGSSPQRDVICWPKLGDPGYTCAVDSWRAHWRAVGAQQAAALHAKERACSSDQVKLASVQWQRFRTLRVQVVGCMASGRYDCVWAKDAAVDHWPTCSPAR